MPMPRLPNTPRPRWRSLFARREARTVALLAVYNFLVMCAFAVVKPVRNALLLEHLGPSWLPVGSIGTAVVTGAVVFVAGWLASRVRERNRVFVTTLALLLNLLMFRWLFWVGGAWVALAFYIWAGLFSNVLFTQFRLIAGNQFTPREAKRLLGWVGAGGIVGAILGPGVAYSAVGVVGAENVIYASAGLLVLCLPLVRYLEGRGEQGGAPTPADPPPQPAASAAAGLDLLREFRHLKLIALIFGVSMVVQTVLDYQFQAIVSEVYTSAAGKTRFFATFFAGMNVASLVFHVFLTRLVLVRFGVGVALSMLPAALMAGSLGILAFPTLLAAALARLGEGGLRYSIEEATREILYLPLPSAVRSRARPLIEMFGARLFEGLGGLLILVCIGVFHLSIDRLSLISVVLILVWAGAVLAVKREYLEALRGLFAEMPVQSRDRAAEILDRETVATLVENLEDANEIQVLRALTMLDLVHDKSGLAPHLKKAMAHPSSAVRTEALKLLRRANAAECVPEAAALLSAPQAEVRLEAVRYLCRFGGGAERHRVAACVNDADARVRVAAIPAVAALGGMGREKIREELWGLWEGSGTHTQEARMEAAYVLGALNDPDYDDLFMRLLCDASPMVVQAVLEAVEQTGRRVFVPVVVSYLADEGLMLYAQRALISYGNRVLGTLRDYMDDPTEFEAVRRAIPGCFAAIATQRSAEVLLNALQSCGPEVKDEVVEALGEVRSRHAEVVFDAGKVEAALLREVQAGGPIRSREAQKHLDTALSLLALIYPSEDIHRAHAGLSSGKRELRSNAVELLDNLLRADLKREVLPHIEAWASREQRT